METTWNEPCPQCNTNILDVWDHDGSYFRRIQCPHCGIFVCIVMMYKLEIAENQYGPSNNK